MLRVWLALFLLFSPALAEAHALNHPMKVVATISILGDFVKVLGGDQVQVVSLVGPDADPFTYKTNHADQLSTNRSDLVIANGLGLEGWLAGLLLNSKESVKVINATTGVQPRYAHDGGIDPHAWLNVAHAEVYVQNICDALVATDPLNAPYYKENTEAYLYQLRKLDHWIKLQMGRIAKGKRRFATGHDSFAYFGAAYGFTVAPLQGMTPDPNTSASDLSPVLTLLKKQQIDTLFYENTMSPRVVEEAAALGAGTVAGKLYADALSEDDGATNYIDMMKTNTQRIYEAVEGPLPQPPELKPPWQR